MRSPIPRLMKATPRFFTQDTEIVDRQIVLYYDKLAVLRNYILFSPERLSSPRLLFETYELDSFHKVVCDWNELTNLITLLEKQI